MMASIKLIGGIAALFLLLAVAVIVFRTSIDRCRPYWRQLLGAVVVIVVSVGAFKLPSLMASWHYAGAVAGTILSIALFAVVRGTISSQSYWEGSTGGSEPRRRHT